MSQTVSLRDWYVNLSCANQNVTYQCLGSQFLPTDSPASEQKNHPRGYDEGEDPRILGDSGDEGREVDESDSDSSMDLSSMPPALARKQLVLATASDIRNKRKSSTDLMETEKKCLLSLVYA